MSAALKAIETAYGGWRFRSRLEARWAVFFENLGVYWRYEPEGWDLGDRVWYLPDFWLYELGAWFEVKGKVPEPEDQAKVERLAAASPYPVFVAAGDCAPPAERAGNELWRLSRVPVGQGWAVEVDTGYEWCECAACGQVGVEFAGRAERLPCPCRARGPYAVGASPRLLVAFDAARHARFDGPRRTRRRATARAS